MSDADPRLRPLMVVPDFDRIGGYELQALSLAQHFQRTGVPTLLVSNNHQNLPPREERGGVTICRVPFLPQHRPNWAALFTAFLAFLRSHRNEYDVIHCHALTFLAACCVRIGRLLGKPVVVKVATERDVREYRDDKSLHFWLFFRWLKTADRLLCLSESIRQEAIACGFRPEQCVLAPNGVDTRRFAPPSAEQRAAARAAFGLGEEFTFLFVGRLVQRKGVDLLLEALARAATDARALVVGDGELRPALEQQAERLGLTDRVRFVGEHQVVLDFLRAADAFVFPSRREGLPNALLEAMSCGLPSIATRIGGSRDVVTEGSGVLVPSDDAPALAAALDRVAGDAGMRRQLSAAGRERVLGAFSFEVTAARLQQVYRELVPAVAPAAR